MRTPGKKEVGDPSGSLNFLAGGGEMGERIRAFDWAATPLGPPESWPQSLKTSIRIMLMSRQPVWIGWGADLLYFYNDPYFSIIGGRHPWALGKPTRDVWREIWDVIGPMLDSAMGGDEGTYVESQRLIMERNGYPEETYYTFSYSPIPNDEGQPGGIFCANSDDTQRVIGQRELALLRDLASRTAKSKSIDEVVERSIGALETNPWDIPFAALYLLEKEGNFARLARSTGIAPDRALTPSSVALADPSFRFGEALRAQAPQTLDIAPFAADLPTGPWPHSVSTAMVLPLPASGETTGGGVLVCGLSPYRLVNDSYVGFMNLVAGQIAAALSDAEGAERDQQRLEAMAELDRAKTAFFANVSHEFRTPLTLMLGPLRDLISQDLGFLPARVQLELETIRRNGVRLQKLVNALLDFSRLEAGRLKAKFCPTDIGTFSAELASSFSSALHRADLDFVVDCPALDSNQYAFVDRDLWEKLVLNLMSNAFKHTFEGSIRLSLTHTATNFQLKVADTGIGISAQDLDHLFERFRRVEGAKARSHEGSGIGLALVQEIVNLHGGSISVSSNTEGAERGTTFTVTIPMGKSHLPPDQVVEVADPTDPRSLRDGASEVAQSISGLLDEGDPLVTQSGDAKFLLPLRSSGARVLVADDNADMRGYISRLIGETYQVECVVDGRAALDSIKEAPPDLVITDVMMPRMNGFDLLKAIRTDPSTAELPVIMLSARAGEESRIEGLDAGADDYLVKPFSARELFARVDSTLSLARLRMEAQEALRENQRRLEMALNAARMVAWQVLPDLLELTASPNLGEIFGIPDAKVIEHIADLDALIHPEDLPDHQTRRNRAIQERNGYVSQYRLIRPVDGQVAWFEERGEVSRQGDGAPVLVGVTMDITRRRFAEIQREDAQALLAAEKNVLEMVMSGAPVQVVLDDLVSRFEGLSQDGMLCSILILSDDKTRLLHGASPSLPPLYQAAIHGLQIGPEVGSFGAAAHRREMVEVPDIISDPHWRDFHELAQSHGLRSCTSLPILSSKGDLLGTVAIYYREPRSASAHDRELMERTARLAGVVIERERAWSAAEAEKARLRDLFTRAPALICVLKGPEHIYELANPIYISTVGRLNESDLVGKSIREAMPELLGQGLFEVLDGVFKTGESYYGVERPIRLDRTGSGELEDSYMNFVYQPSRNIQGEVDGILVHAVDVTDQVLARRKAEQLAQELENKVEERTRELTHANEQLQGFTYSVAHDLRQQIRRISSNAGMILLDEADRLNQSSTTKLERMVSGAHQLSELVDDLLSYAKNGIAQVQPEEVDLSGMAAEISEALFDTGQYTRDTQMVVELTPIAFVDRSMARVILENLIENAFKYSRGTEQPRVVFGFANGAYFVRDNGIGFDMRFVHKLFLAFERLHSDPSIAGTGIGLANVKRLIDKHHGKIWAEGSVGQGATVWFSLPKPTFRTAESPTTVGIGVFTA